MTKYIQGKDGKLTGSIGVGKTKIPSPRPHAPTPPVVMCQDCEQFPASKPDNRCTGCHNSIPLDYFECSHGHSFCHAH